MDYNVSYTSMGTTYYLTDHGTFSASKSQRWIMDRATADRVVLLSNKRGHPLAKVQEEERKIACIFSVSPRKGTRGVSVKDAKGKHMYYNAPKSEVAIEGKCVLMAERDTVFGDEKSQRYQSGVLVNPTWATVFRHFRKSIPVTRDFHHCFLEGVHPKTRLIAGKHVPQFMLDVPIYEFTAGS